MKRTIPVLLLMLAVGTSLSAAPSTTQHLPARSSTSSAQTTSTSYRDRALAADAANQTAQALSAIDAGLKANPRDAGLLAAQGRIYWRLLRTNSAERAYDSGKSEDQLREAIRLAVRRCATAWTGKKPLVEVMLVRSN